MGNLAQTLINYAVPGGCGARVVYAVSHTLTEPFLLGQPSGGMRKQRWSTWQEDVERHRPDIVVLSAAAHVYGSPGGHGSAATNETQHMEEILADVERGISHFRHSDRGDQTRPGGSGGDGDVNSAPFAPRFVWKDTAALVHPKAMTARAAPVTSAWVAEQKARARAAAAAENRTVEESALVSSDYQHALFSAWDELAAAAMARAGADHLSMAPLQLRPDAHLPGDSLHYCVPGPYDIYARVFLALLLAGEL